MSEYRPLVLMVEDSLRKCYSVAGTSLELEAEQNG